MSLTSAYLLVFHGSRDSRSLSAASQLARLTVKQLNSKIILPQRNELSPQSPFLANKISATSRSAVKPLVDIAALELARLPLHQSIIKFAQAAQKKGYKQIKLIPLFLGAGVHVRQDIPQEIALAKETLGEAISIKSTTYLGDHTAMSRLLRDRFIQLSAEARILLAHGSRSVAGNASTQSLATQLQAEAAYWSVAPNLSDRVKALITSGKSKIAILPYFLFTGKIFEAIASEVERLRHLFPQTSLILGEPLGATPELAALIAEVMSQ